MNRQFLSARQNNILRILAIGSSLLALVFVFTLRPPIAHAASLVVTSAADTAITNGVCSLREAITNANDNAASYSDCAAGSGADTITFQIPAGDSGCTAANVCTITLGSRLPVITDSLTLNGAANSARITISGNSQYRALLADIGVPLAVNSMTITLAYCEGCGGGAIYGGGDLNVQNSTFLYNRVDSSVTAGSGGAAIYALGNLTIVNSTFRGNRVDDFLQNGAVGGAIQGANMTIQNSTFVDNHSVGSGGAIYNAGIASISNSTFTQNTAKFGGAFFSAYTLNLYNSTLAGNSADQQGAGISSNYAANLYNTIVANFKTVADCTVTGGSLTADNFNIDSDGSCGNATTRTAEQLNLQPLANNGGATQTIALASGSAAANTGNNAVCAAAPVNALDQRGVTRPQAPRCDVGAFELQITGANGLIVFRGRVKPEGIVLRWRTSSESHIAGFNIWRRIDKNKWKLYAGFIRAKHAGDRHGDEYRFLDIHLKPNQVHRYKLEVVYLDHHSEWSAVVRIPAQ